ncbi:hypothetical protein A1O3_10211 [Capronia epimyces CBS 606.96]|uniref:Xylanolytic transcriptional activator regulatory domain-containing protein n=1 Tax=Capronia epimyces CBS 606.96 TaxID=1182542 RepID=W9XA10_9EURO|nr:uncharacterized protein A1O3_10211 [Capronia epimyces CBS 606.96]EXJ77053.1 hypothetical protein A1O3_10211 [Capronia epimyces CBS 606.96]
MIYRVSTIIIIITAPIVRPPVHRPLRPFQSNRNPVVGGGGFDALLRRPPSRSAPEPGTLLCDQVLGLLEATGMYLDEISVGYFQGGIHSVVPIISRRRFHTHLISFGGDDDTTRLRRRRPRAEFALLLLTMALLLVGDESVDHPAAKLADHHLWRRRRRRPLPQQIDRTKLYLAIKSLLAQAQALHAFGSSTPSTTHLIQAGVLLAVYEYASGRPEQAFVSIGNYARMAHLAQLQYPSGSSSSSLSSSSSRPHRFSSSKDEEQEQEEINIWWGILICERTFLCEMPLVMDRPPPLASVMPDPDIPLPKLVESLDSGGGDGGGGTPTVGGFLVDALASPQPVQVDSFGRAAQAAWLLDRLIQSTRLSPAGHMAGAIDVDDNDATNTKRVYLEECDKMLQSFLTILMQQTDKDDDDDDWVGHYYCVAIALTIRSLFLLHEHILDHHDHLGNKNSNNSNSNKNNNNKNSSSSSSSNNSSRSALDTVTNIVIDITASHQHLSWDQIDQLPPSSPKFPQAFRIPVGNRIDDDDDDDDAAAHSFFLVFLAGQSLAE